MVLHLHLFPSASLQFLNDLSWKLIFPCYWLLDHLVASFVSTTQEKRQCSQDPCASLTPCVLLSTPLYLLLIVLWLPFALLGFLVWAPLQTVRRPYLYSHRRVNAREPQREWKPQGRSYCFSSANVCLLPDALSRVNNLSDTQGRAREVGRRICNGATRPQIKIYIDSPTNSSVSANSFSSLGLQQGAGISQVSSTDYKPVEQQEEQQGLPDCPLHVAGVQISIPEQAKVVAGGEGSPDSCVTSQESLTRVHSGNGGVSTNSLSHHTSALTNANGYKPGCFNGSFDHEISAFFPANLDFLCLQEVFDKQAEVKLRRELHSYFPFILSDVGRYAWKGCCSRFKCLNSGLLLASRYPILDADYYCYPNGQGEDALAAKGVLCAKVLLGKSPNDQRIVGYIACTHLHSIEGDSVVRFEQLDLLLECGIIFRKATKRQRDQIAFDVVMGDLNSDNCSSDDKLEQQHRIFRHYKDPCRLGPREDQPWALGTLLNISALYNEDVSTPENMQKVMEHEEARKEYLVYPVGKKQCSKKKGQKTPLRGNGRRIDYILYSEEVQPPGWKVAVEEYSFITQLATLTDHLPVSMRLAVSTGVEVS
ncbi:hypothetical protein AGOR_G00169480 [Albula goreensis]|uniref:sphingomyelin phosphodiesterase n=1 Tax=Albula goreensis TaxID=1534307 RepID=A0A8T3D613_9TELE|nr:hypothetical protein AGOR_G00169480 [Albula goreensis]